MTINQMASPVKPTAKQGSQGAPAQKLSTSLTKSTKPSRERSRLGHIGLRLTVPAALVLIWYGLSESQAYGLFIANPLDAVQRVFSDFFSTEPGRAFLGDAFYGDLVPSVYRALAGLILATMIGVGVGVLLGSNRVLSAMFSPLIHLGRSLPSPALLGVFFLLFGTGDSPKVFLITFSVVWPILFNTIDGVQSVGMVRMQAVEVFRVSRWATLIHVILPGAAPKIFAGVRIAMSLSLIIMIISELQKAENGLGYLLIQAQRNFDYTGFWAVLIVLAALGVVLNIIFKMAERYALAWHRGATAQND